MVVKLKEKELSSFLQYMTEADNETPRTNMKVVNMRVSDGRRPDYTSNADVPEEEEEAPDDNTEEMNDTTGTEDAGGDAEQETDVQAEEPVTDDDTDFTDDDGGGEPAENATPTDGDVEEPADDATPTDGEDTQPAEGEGEGGGTEDSNAEKLYKYNLYTKFEKILTTLTDYIKDLELITSDDSDLNQKYKELVKKLSAIKELMTDYMIMRFSKVSFMQSMLFYQRVVTSINIILETMKNIRKTELKTKI